MTIRQQILTFVRIELKGAPFTSVDLRPLHLCAAKAHLTYLVERDFIAQIGATERKGKAAPCKIYELRNPVYTKVGREKFSGFHDSAWRDVFPSLFKAHKVPIGVGRKISYEVR